MEKHFLDEIYTEACKIYIDIKRAHAKELRTVGYIKYNKYDETNNS